MEKFHSIGHHTYRIAKEIVEADLIINIPKLKTHMKSGMTAAMKNFVGVVGNKECLPHHIKGHPLYGGDCYGDFSLLKLISENIMDEANEYLLSDEKRYYEIYSKATRLLNFRSRMCLDGDLSGSWYGNDTICRTIVDLNRIVYYGGKDGQLHKKRQREIISLVDAIVSGQGEGPMRPLPNNTKFLCVSDSTALADIVCAEMIGLKSQRIRYLKKDRVRYDKYPIISAHPRYLLNGSYVELKEIVKMFKPKIKQPQRWGGVRKREIISGFVYFKKFAHEIFMYPKRIKKWIQRNKKLTIYKGFVRK